MGAAHGKASDSRYVFFSDLAKKTVAVNNSSSSNSGSASSSSTASQGDSSNHSVLWVTEGILHHGTFVLTELEDPRHDTVRHALLQELIDLNPETRRISLLLHLACLGVDQAICNSGGGVAPPVASSTPAPKEGSSRASPGAPQRPSGISTQTARFLCPLLRLCGCVIRYAAAAAQGDDLLLRKQLDSAAGAAAANAMLPSVGLATRLCQLLMDFVATVPLDAASTVLHHEATIVLLSLCSTALYHGAEFDEQRVDTFVELMLSSDIIKPVFATLIQRVVAWGAGLLPETTYVYRSGYEPSIKNLYNFFGTMARSDQYASLTDVLGRHTAHLLTVLVVHQRGNGVNHAADCFRQLVHGDFVDFEMLLYAIERKVASTPCLAAIVYVLLIDHPTFLHTVLSKWPERLANVVNSLLHLAVKTAPLDYAPLQSAHDTPSDSPQVDVALRLVNQPFRLSFQNLYVQCIVATILCVLSKDRSYHELAFRHHIEPTFVGDRYLSSTTVGNLTLAVCSKAVARALGDRSNAVARLFLATIENASPFTQNIDAYGAQRLLGLLTTLLRRMQRLEAALAKESSSPQEHRMEASYSLLAERDVLLSPLQFLSESILAMLEGRNRGNNSLTYELLYHRDIIFSLSASTVMHHECSGPVYDAHVRSQQLDRILKPLRDVIANYESEMASVAVNHSPEDILRLIDRVANSTGTYLAGSGDAGGGADPRSMRSHSGRDLLYLYQEAKESGSFFTPFVWATIVSESGCQPGTVDWCANESVGAACFALFYPAVQNVSS